MDNPYQTLARDRQVADPSPDTDLEPNIETADDANAFGGKRPVPRVVWIWLAGIVASLLVMMLLIFKGTDSNRATSEPALGLSSAETVRIPQAPNLEQDPNTATDLPLPPLPPLPMPPATVQLPPSPPPAVPSTAQPYVAYAPPATVEWQANETAPRATPGIDERRAGTFTPAPSGNAEDRYLNAMTAAVRNVEQAPVPAPANGSDSQRVTQGGGESSGVRRVANLSTLLVQGTLLPCTLETALVTDQDGPATCRVISPVYSADGKNVLLAEGTRLFGRYQGVDVRRARVSILWQRLLTPSGVSATLQSISLDPDGSAGVSGIRNAHWGSRIGGTLMVSVLSDAFKYFAARKGPRSTTSYGMGNVVEEPFQSHTAQSMQALVSQAVQESSESRPTVTIPAGTRIHVHVDSDLDFSGVVMGS